MTASPRRRNVQLDTALYRARVEQVQAHLDRQGLANLLLLNAANIMWATGFFHIPNERPLGLHIPCDGAGIPGPLPGKGERRGELGAPPALVPRIPRRGAG